MQQAAYVNLLSYLPKSAATNLYFLLENISYEASSHSKEILDKLKSQLVTSCSSNLTLLDASQGNYTNNYTMSCPGDELDTIQVGCLADTECMMGPFLKCATDFIDKYQDTCIDAESFLLTALMILGAGSIILLGLAYKTRSNSNTTDATLSDINTSSDYVALRVPPNDNLPDSTSQVTPRR